MFYNGRFNNWLHSYPQNIDRPSWDEYFLLLAFLASRRSACYRSQCGAVIVKDNNVIGTGYNGSPTYQPNCQEIGFCYRNKNNILSGTELERCRACGSHSESNAIALSAKRGHSTLDADMYIFGNSAICTQCRAIIANAGIKRVIYMDRNYQVFKYDVSSWTVHPIDINK